VGLSSQQSHGYKGASETREVSELSYKPETVCIKTILTNTHC
jgi:hypothetical protein